MQFARLLFGGAGGGAADEEGRGYSELFEHHFSHRSEGNDGVCGDEGGYSGVDSLFGARARPARDSGQHALARLGDDGSAVEGVRHSGAEKTDSASAVHSRTGAGFRSGGSGAVFV